MKRLPSEVGCQYITGAWVICTCKHRRPFHGENKPTLFMRGVYDAITRKFAADILNQERKNSKRERDAA